MRILTPNVGPLTNFEVLNFLVSRGAAQGKSRVLAPIAPSEYKVYDYLIETPAATQKLEHITEFLERCRQFDLAKGEIVSLINVRPTQLVEMDPIVEELEQRFGERMEDLVELVEQVLPPPPASQQPGEEIGVDTAETGDGVENDGDENMMVDETEAAEGDQGGNDGNDMRS